MIEDEELRGLFETESCQHLETLEQGLLSLERNPGDKTILGEVFRAAHSLKGSARMLGISSVEALTHRLEDCLDSARRGRSPFTAAKADILYKALDGLADLVQEAVTGHPSQVDLRALLADLERVDEEELPPPALPATQEEAVLEERPPESSGEATAPFHIATVRVETPKLDAILTKVGDLQVNAARSRLRLEELSALRGFFEEWTLQARRRGSGLWEQHQLVPEAQRLQRLGVMLSGLEAGLTDDHSRLDSTTQQLAEDVAEIRLLPFSAILGVFPRFLRDLAKQQQKAVRLVIEGEHIGADKRIIEEFKDPLMHLLRNAVDHGIELPSLRLQQGKPAEATLRVTIAKSKANLEIDISDDGAGLDFAAIARKALQQGIYTAEELAEMSPAELQSLIFASGFSTRSLVTELSGRGVGLDVVRSRIQGLNGSISVESRAGQGTTFHIRLPNSISTLKVLICRLGERAFAIPVDCVARICSVQRGQVASIEGRLAIRLASELAGENENLAPVSAAWLSALLDMPGNRTSVNSQPCVVITQNEERMALLVDHLADVQEVVVKGLGPLWGEQARPQGAAILPSGQVCLVLSPSDLFQAARRSLPSANPQSDPEDSAQSRRYRVLLAEDSLTMRTQEKRILETAGYDVVAAVDGLEAWEKLTTGSFDAVVSDIQMPNLDGLALTRRIREQPHLRNLPIVLLTSLASDDDRLQGIAAGANAYLTKPTFNPKVFLETLDRLL